MARVVANKLLAALPRRDRRQLATSLEPVVLSYGDVLFEAGELIRSVYFLDSGLVSILLPQEDGKVAEVAIVGREGMVDLPVFLGAKAHPHRVVVQARGAAWRMPAAALWTAVQRSAALSEQMLHYANAFLGQVSQQPSATACTLCRSATVAGC